MNEFYSPYSEPLPHIPDYLTVVQFILDSPHPIRPLRKHGIPWLIDDNTGRTVDLEEVSNSLVHLCRFNLNLNLFWKLRLRTYGLANALSFKYNIGEPDLTVSRIYCLAVLTGENDIGKYLVNSERVQSVH